MKYTEEGSRQLIIDLSHELVKRRLVARTYGNISVCYEDNRMAISPSGMAYEALTVEDIPVYYLDEGRSCGIRRPSSEYKIHVAAAKAGAIVSIHTHQDYATAVSLIFNEGAIDSGLEMSEEESKLLRGIAVAGYGLPGSDELANNVEKAIALGARSILMKHHGCLFLADSPEEAIMMADAMEQVCRRYVEATVNTVAGDNARKELMSHGFNTQLDDMAQMIGDRLNVISQDEQEEYFTNNDVAFVAGSGIVVKNQTKDDTVAIVSLIEKAIICKQLTEVLGINADLSKEDCEIMRNNYLVNYSKQINIK